MSEWLQKSPRVGGYGTKLIPRNGIATSRGEFFCPDHSDSGTLAAVDAERFPLPSNDLDRLAKRARFLGSNHGIKIAKYTQIDHGPYRHAFRKSYPCL
jgi:hypothetical protein